MTGPRRLSVPVSQAEVEERCRRLEQLTASRHATDLEPVGRVLDTAKWREAQWRRAIPARFHAATLEQVRQVHGDDPAESLTMWVECTGARPNVLLFGPVGVGKSHAAVAALRGVYDREHTVAYWPVTTLLEATSPGGADPAGALASATQADVLVLDDLGVERDTEWVQERVYEVVNQRWLEEVPTIVTTNLPDAAALCEAVGERVYSRLQDGAVGIRLTGGDRRRT